MKGRQARRAIVRIISISIFINLVLCARGPAAYGQDTTGINPSTDSLSTPGLPSTVEDVLIFGNDKTRDFVILREMSLRVGEEITAEKLDYDRERIYSLRLFNQVQVNASPSGPGKSIITVEVDERWYIFPFPVLGVRDRDWSKVFYGAGIVHNNFRGRNEKLFASIVLGYDPAVSLFYRNSFLDREGAWFMDAKTSYGRVRNRSPQVEARVGDYDERHFMVFSNIGRRTGRHHSIWMSAGYRVVDLVASQIPLVGPAETRDEFPMGGMGYSFDTRDVQEYPTMGTMVGVTIMKYGIPGRRIDYFRIATDVRHFFQFPGGLVLAGRLFTDNGGGREIPVYSRVYFGYSERIRGHFTRVIEGDNLAGATVELHLPILEPRYLRVSTLPAGFNLWRFGIGVALFGDAGSAWFRDSKFSVANLSKGYGGGIHLLLPYSSVLRLEYAWDELRRGEFIVDLGAAL